MGCVPFIVYYTLFIEVGHKAFYKDKLIIMKKFGQTIIFTLCIVGAINAADLSTGIMSAMFMLAAALLLALSLLNIFYNHLKN